MTQEEVRFAVVDALENLKGLPVEKEIVQPLYAADADMVIADLGLESLDSVEWCMEIEARTGVALDPVDFASVSSVVGLIDMVVGRIPRTKVAKTQSASRDQPLPLSFMQERIWRICQALGGSAGYVLRLRDGLRGPLDVGLLKDCLSEIVRRHEILRTTYASVQGAPVQIIHPAEPVMLPVHELPAGVDPEEESLRIIAAERSLVADLERGPLARFSLLRISDTEHWMLRVWHHILADGESNIAFFEELKQLYALRREGQSPSLPELEQYGDYAIAQRKMMASDQPARHDAIAWWQECFARKSDFQGPHFVRQRQKSVITAVDGNVNGAALDADAMARLGNLRREQGATVYLLWLAAIIGLLAVEGRRKDFVVGSYMTNRRRAALRNTIGDFTNLVPLRLECDAGLAFSGWLSVLRDRVASAEKYCDVPYEELRTELSARGVAPPDIHMIVASPLNLRDFEERFADLTLVRLPQPASTIMPWGFTFKIREEDGTQRCNAGFDAERYDTQRVKDFVDRLPQFLRGASLRPDIPVRELAGSCQA